MMRVSIVAAALAACAAQASASGLEELLWSCGMAKDRAYCEVQQAQFIEEWPKANGGDYASQRNVAFCLLNSCDGAVRVDGIASCAWRTVIIASDAGWDWTDLEQYKSDCAGVKKEGEAMAKALFRRIYKRAMPAID